MHNTYGERHCYPLSVEDRKATVDKEFYVSRSSPSRAADIRTRLTADDVAIAISLTTPTAVRRSRPRSTGLEPATWRTLRRVAANPFPSQRVAARSAGTASGSGCAVSPSYPVRTTRHRKAWTCTSTTIDGPGQESLAAAQESLATGENTAARTLPPAPAYGLRARVAKQVLARILRNVPVTARLATGEVYGGGR